MSFVLGTKVDHSKVFIERKGNATGRWDPFYYRPDLVELESQVAKVTSLRLRDLVMSMAGGATPSTKEAETHYTEGEGGVPFIRVQNLSTTGKLMLDDCKYITRGTHEGLLKRSQLSGGELLVKVTGVGRMAIACVVSEGFEGNINQHMVAIRTKDIATSETLAAWLNLDTAERLATRRSTGGTRPALDYPALLSMPVILDQRIPNFMMAAIRQHQEQVEKANELLQGIDDALLLELGIPSNYELHSTLNNRIYNISLSGLTGERFDPNFHRPEYQKLITLLKEAPYATIRDLIQFSTEQWDQNSLFQDVFPYLEIGSVDLAFGKLTSPSLTPISEAANRAKMIVRPGDLLVSLTRPTRRAICFAPDDYEVAIASNGFAIIREVKNPDLNSRYLFHMLRSKICVAQFEQRSSGGNYPAINEEQFSKIIIPLPSPDTQRRIVGLLDQQYAKAETLLAKASDDLEKAKRDIEAMILGKEVTK